MDELPNTNMAEQGETQVRLTRSTRPVSGKAPRAPRGMVLLSRKTCQSSRQRPEYLSSWPTCGTFTVTRRLRTGRRGQRTCRKWLKDDPGTDCEEPIGGNMAQAEFCHCAGGEGYGSAAIGDNSAGY